MHHRSLLGEASRPFCRTQVPMESYNSWRTGLVCSLSWCYKNRSVQLWEDGIWGQYGIEAKHRDLSGWLSISLLQTLLPRSSLYDSCMFWVTFPLLEPHQSVQDQDLLCWPFKRSSGFLYKIPFFSHADKVPTDSHCQILHQLLFQFWCSWMGIHHSVETPHSPWWTFEAKITLQILNHCTCMWEPSFLVPVPSLPVSM